MIWTRSIIRVVPLAVATPAYSATTTDVTPNLGGGGGCGGVSTRTIQNRNGKHPLCEQKAGLMMHYVQYVEGMRYALLVVRTDLNKRDSWLL